MQLAMPAVLAKAASYKAKAKAHPECSLQLLKKQLETWFIMRDDRDIWKLLADIRHSVLINFPSKHSFALKGIAFLKDKFPVIS